MTSPAKIRANRRNALRSAGPRSPVGKAMAARNARRHGLTLPVLDEPSLAREAVDLARRIETSQTGREADAAGHALAYRIAEAIIDFRRVRIAKLPLAAALDADPGDAGAMVRLSRLDRYEVRAFARSKRAIRDFDADTLAEELTKRSQRRDANDFKQADFRARMNFGRTNPIRDMRPAIAIRQNEADRAATAILAEQTRSAPGRPLRRGAFCTAAPRYLRRASVSPRCADLPGWRSRDEPRAHTRRHQVARLGSILAKQSQPNNLVISAT
jgi:hypothetical protein